MNYHALWLIYYKKVIILVQNIKRNCFRFNIQRLHIRNFQAYFCFRLDFVIGFYRLSINKNSLFLQKLLKIGT